MATVIQGDDRTFDAIVYGPSSEKTRNALRKQFDNIPVGVLESNPFIARAYELYNQHNGDAARDLAREIISRYDTNTDPNLIYHLRTLKAMQSAPPIMQRYILANPTVHALRIKQRLDAYDDVFTSFYGDNTKQDDITESVDYNQVMNGKLDTTTDSFRVSWGLTPLQDCDRELTPEEQLALYETWESMDAILNNEDNTDDPTNPYGGSL